MREGTRLSQGRSKAQASMVLIALLILVMAAIAVLLFSLARTVSQEDYMDMYVNNLLLSIMRTDTGFTDPECMLVSDATACAFILPEQRCGTSGPTCLQLANQTLNDYTRAFDLISRNYRYLFEVTSYDFIARAGDDPGEGMKLMFGDPSLEGYQGRVKAANYAVQKTLAGRQYNLRVRLKVARRTG